MTEENFESIKKQYLHVGRILPVALYGKEEITVETLKDAIHELGSMIENYTE